MPAWELPAPQYSNLPSADETRKITANLQMNV